MTTIKRRHSCHSPCSRPHSPPPRNSSSLVRANVAPLSTAPSPRRRLFPCFCHHSQHQKFPAAAAALSSRFPSTSHPTPYPLVFSPPAIPFSLSFSSPSFPSFAFFPLALVSTFGRRFSLSLMFFCCCSRHHHHRKRPNRCLLTVAPRALPPHPTRC